MAHLEDQSHWPRLSRLLDEALDQPTAQLEGWLEALAPEDRSLEPRLRKLLSYAQTGGLAKRLATLPRIDSGSGPTAGEGDAVDGRAGALVGPFRLIRLIGEGGQGGVWLAERADGMLQRQVAVKLPRGAWQPGVLAERVAREREILASLSHPHIARLYDAGVTAAGQPWLALEYVEGLPLDAYLKKAHLGVRDRLALFLQLADAVAHAHGHLVVHRDLKPSNVLVTAEGEARLLDFGIAKLLEQGRAQETDLTRLGGRALTPGYASPEQIQGKAIGVGTDVYSLGVLLFEMLTGARPYRPARDTPAALEEAILLAEPTRPSLVAPDAATGRQLRGDLDAVVQKALKKRPEERYLAVNAFAEDVERWLTRRPVRARPDSRGYRLWRFVGRNRLAVAAATAVSVAVLAGAGVAVWQGRAALAEQRRAEEVKEFIEAIFREANPYGAQGRVLSGVELLQQARLRIDRATEMRPELRVELLNLVGESLLGLGSTDAAEQAVGQALQEAARGLPGDHPQALRARLLATDVSRIRGRTEGMRQELDRLMPELERQAAERPAELVRALQYRAHLALDEARNAEAVTAAQAAFDLALARLGPGDPRTVDASNLLAETWVLLPGAAEEALVVAERAMRLAAQAYRDQPLHPRVVAMRETWARALAHANREAEALEVFGQALREARQVFGSRSPLVGEIASHMVPAQRRLGDALAAIQSADAALEALGHHMQTDSRTRSVALGHRGMAHLLARHGAEALRDLTESEALLARRNGPEDRDAVITRIDRGLALAYVGRVSEARVQLRASIEEVRALVPRRLWYATLHLGSAERLGGNREEAHRLLVQSLAAIADDGARDWLRLRALPELALAQADLSRFEEARLSAEEALALSRRLQTHDSPMRADALLALGRAWMGQGKASDGLVPLAQADAFWRGFDAESRWAGEAALWLGRCLVALGRADDARPALARAARILRRSPFPADTALLARVRRP